MPPGKICRRLLGERGAGSPGRQREGGTHASDTLDAVIDGGRFVVLSRWVDDRTQIFRLVDTETGDVTEVPSRWISEDGGRMAFVQVNVAPDAVDRLILAPVIR